MASRFYSEGLSTSLSGGFGEARGSRARCLPTRSKGEREGVNKGSDAYSPLCFLLLPLLLSLLLIFSPFNLKDHSVRGGEKDNRADEAANVGCDWEEGGGEEKRKSYLLSQA